MVFMEGISKKNDAKAYTAFFFFSLATEDSLSISFVLRTVVFGLVSGLSDDNFAFSCFMTSWEISCIGCATALMVGENKLKNGLSSNADDRS